MNSDKTQWVDLACRALGGGVIYANDELFADRENLIKPADPVFQPHTFGNKGQIMDGWETRRRREPGSDSAIVRLGCARRGAPRRGRHLLLHRQLPAGGVGRGVRGRGVPGARPNWPRRRGRPWCRAARWPATPATSSRSTVEQRFTHVRLTMFPDGGVARLRVYGEPVPDPRLLPATIDLAALENGAVVTGCSNMFYSSPANLLMPGLARVMGDGWETSRRRDAGNDWVAVRLACAGSVEVVELDTSHFVGNAPGLGGARLRRRGPGAPAPRCSPTPATASPWPAARWPSRCGSTSTRTVAWPGCGCSGRRPARPGRRWPTGSSACCRRPQLAGLLRAAGLPPDEAGRLAAARAGLADLPPGRVRAVPPRSGQIHNRISYERSRESSWPSPSATTSTARRRSAWSTSPATVTGTRSRT